VIVASSALLMVGSLLPWTVWDSGYGNVTSYGWKAGGPTTLFLGLVVLALAIPIARSSPRVGWPIGAMCLFVVALFVSGNHIAQVLLPASYGGAFSVGVGVWLCLAASIIGALASLFVWRLLSAVGVAVATPPAT
jgi:hypothetical protein